MKTQIEAFRCLIETVHSEYCNRHGFEIRDEVTVRYGKKYAKLLVGSSVHSFIDMTTGDIYKAATCKAPAKHVRGNINSEHKGRESLDSGSYQVRYLN